MQEIITTIITTAASVLGFLVSFIIAIVQTIKKTKIKDGDNLYERAVALIEDAESVYKPIEDKQIDCGVMKKQYVMSNLQIYAATKGFKFDIETWSEEVEKLIQFTHKVNAHEVTEKEISVATDTIKGVIL